MANSERFLELVSGRRRGTRAALLRGGLSLAAKGYAAAVGLRNLRYDVLGSPRCLDIPVISVGNLTVGGTGKTPMAIWLCEQLAARGLKPAVLSRGYGATRESPPDELRLVTRRCPQAVGVANADRHAAGRLAIAELNAQAAVLDDGFQHRQLARDLDLLLIDAACPFGYERILPRGLLRESVAGLARADAVVLTRCDQVPEAELAGLEERIRAVVEDLPILRSVHRPLGWVDLNGKAVEPPDAHTLAAFAGIAQPEKFFAMLKAMGLSVAACRSYDDHQVYTESDAAVLSQWAAAGGADMLVTTEKDAVKLADMPVEWPVPVRVLQIGLQFMADDEKRLAAMVEEVLAAYGCDPQPGEAE